MKLYIWRHNKKFHSYSMINEPCVNNEFYTDALAVVAANSIEEAAALLAAGNEGWHTEDLLALSPSVYDLDRSKVIYTEIRGN